MVELKYWQATAMAKFLLAAANRAVVINIKVDSEGIVLEAITGNGEVATMRVYGDKRHIVMCVDEWGLMAELE